jgi:hypothetical protein
MSLFQIIKENAFVIMMIVGVMQFMFTVFITIILHRNARRQMRFEVQRSIDSQWQDLNKMVISNPEVQQALKNENGKEKSNDSMIRLNLLYYTLNTFQQVIRAKENGFISEFSANQLISGHIDFFKQIPNEVDALLIKESGFDKLAIDELRKYWKR